jgi:MPBQ/MSBQ methyltransferase
VPEHRADAETRLPPQGDAENLPFDTDSADRYVSAGSIEYWPDPQRGIAEAYRVIKPGGLACLIGPVYPTFWLSRMMADFWMLFPTEQVVPEVRVLALCHVTQTS